jgi:hypothetical protein
MNQRYRNIRLVELHLELPHHRNADAVSFTYAVARLDAIYEIVKRMGFEPYMMMLGGYRAILL